MMNLISSLFKIRYCESVPNIMPMFYIFFPKSSLYDKLSTSTSKEEPSKISHDYTLLENSERTNSPIFAFFRSLLFCIACSRESSSVSREIFRSFSIWRAARSVVGESVDLSAAGVTHEPATDIASVKQTLATQEWWRIKIVKTRIRKLILLWSCECKFVSIPHSIQLQYCIKQLTLRSVKKYLSCKTGFICK